MRVAIFGLGYVGCVSAACFARDGHDVIGVDVNPLKVEQVNAGVSPVIEPGLEELVARERASGRLIATADGVDAAADADVLLVCVGTPSNGNGSLDLRHVEKVCTEIGAGLARRERGMPMPVVVIRSTVLPGTIDGRLLPALEESSGMVAGIGFGICANPEFLREGSAIADFDKPPFVIVGIRDGETSEVMARLYERTEAPFIGTDIGTAEMIKYISNAFHALKVAFANEVGALCKSAGIDAQEVMEVFCRERTLNISPTYLRPGFAFGGSCLPKDVRALVYRAKEADVAAPVLNAVLESNRLHIQRCVDMVERTGARRAAILGLSFKAGTDDVRESPAVTLTETLVGRGFSVAVYDEHVDPDRLVGANKAALERELPHIAALMRPSIDDVLEDAEVVVVTNGSRAFADVPKRLGPDQLLIDLVGIARQGLNGSDVKAYEGISW
jgi:GDP-mannose 6-dehydrogenase